MRRRAGVLAVVSFLVGVGLDLGDYSLRWVSYLLLVTAALVGIWGVYPWIRTRLARPAAATTPPPRIHRAKERPAPTALLPWVDEGQLVLTYKSGGASSAAMHRPASWRCDLTLPSGKTLTAWAGHVDQVVPWQSVVRYPTDFEHGHPLRPGAYKVEWWIGRFTQNNPLEVAGWALGEQRSFVVADDLASVRLR